MKKYEYKGVYRNTEMRDDLVDDLNQWGEEGWNVVSILPLESSNPANPFTLYWYIVFVREVL